MDAQLSISKVTVISLEATLVERTPTLTISGPLSKLEPIGVLTLHRQMYFEDILLKSNGSH